MKKDMFNYSTRLEDVLFQTEKRDSDTICAVDNLMHEKKHYRIICEEQLKVADPDDETPELDLGKGFTDLEMYHDLMRSARLLSLVGRKPQEFMSEEADFLFGCPLRYEIFTDDEIDAIRFDPNVEAADDRTYYYIWIIFGAFDEVKMAAKVDSERGTVHPLPFIPVQSEYEHFYHSKDREFLTSSERNILIDRIFYPILIPDEIVTKSKDEEKNCDDYEDDTFEWDVPDIEDFRPPYDSSDDDSDLDEDEDDDDGNEDTDNEDDSGNIWYDEEKDEEEDTDSKSDDEVCEDEINPQDLERMRLFCETMRDIRVLSVTDLIGNDKETMFFPQLYANMKNFVGKLDKIAIGERMYIFHPKPKLNPYCPEVRIHTSTVMFHSEELISENEIKHIVRTINSIYTFIEYKKEH